MVNASFRGETLKRACALAILFIIFSCAPLFADDDPDKFQLDADSVTYQDETGIVFAEGDVRISNRDMRLLAPFVKYDTPNDTIRADGDTRNPVTLVVGDKSISGRSLRYNVITGRGILTNARGRAEAIHLYGGGIEVMPISLAAEEKIVTKRTASAVSEDELVARWSDVTATTCNFKNPHYRLVSKQVLVIPDNRVVVKRPALYLGKKMILKYPFDHLFWIGKAKADRQSSLLLPSIAYDSKKSVGVTIGGPIAWDGGEINVECAYWLKDIWEARLGINQSIGRGFSVFAETDRLYDRDTDETKWRQRWGLKYANSAGWRARLWESQRELVKTEMKLGITRSYTVWRRPELEIYSPWFASGRLGGHYRIFGIVGRYQDNVEVVKPWVRRIGGGAQIYAESKVNYGVFKPFYNVTYRYYDYETDETQKITDLIAGVRWRAGDVRLGTAYVRRWVDGSSPLVWDRFQERENIYQKVAFAIPGKQPWERWEISVRAGYDIKESSLAEMVYTLGYNQHCLKWELWARDNRTDSDVSVGLRLTVNAFPDNALELGIDKIFDPFRNPVTGKGDDFLE